MWQAQAPSAIDQLQGRLSPALKWGFAGAGAAAGWYYACTDATPIPVSYIVLGAVAGYCLIAGIFASLRLARLAAIAGVLLIALNYAVLIPFGYGDCMPGCIATGKAALRWLDPSRLVGRWGKDTELRPPSR